MREGGGGVWRGGHHHGRRAQEQRHALRPSKHLSSPSRVIQNIEVSFCRFYLSLISFLWTLSNAFTYLPAAVRF